MRHYQNLQHGYTNNHKIAKSLGFEKILSSVFFLIDLLILQSKTPAYKAGVFDCSITGDSNITFA